MNRRFILRGDKTDRNGVVVDGIANTSFQGQPVAVPLSSARLAARRASSSATARRG